MIPAYIFFWLVLMDVGVLVAILPALMVLLTYISALFVTEGTTRSLRVD